MACRTAELPDYICLAAENSPQRDLARAGQAVGVESPGTIDGTTVPGYNTITEAEGGRADGGAQAGAQLDRAAGERVPGLREFDSSRESKRSVGQGALRASGCLGLTEDKAAYSRLLDEARAALFRWPV